jgi:sortase A
MTALTTSPHVSPPPAATPRWRRRVQILGWTLVWLGVLTFGYLGYQLWGTGVYTASEQTRLDQQLAERLALIPTPSDSPPPTPVDASGEPAAPADIEKPTAPALISEEAPEEGEALGRIQIPAAGIDYVLVSGVTPEVLKKGPGHMPWTPLPGQPGNAVISGHRTTYGAPFFDLDQVGEGDQIQVSTLIGTHTYQVREILVVEPTDVWVTDPRPGAWLTLTTCTPRYSAAQRLIVFAELVDGPNLGAIQTSSNSPPRSVG